MKPGQRTILADLENRLQKVISGWLDGVITDDEGEALGIYFSGDEAELMARVAMTVLEASAMGQEVREANAE